MPLPFSSSAAAAVAATAASAAVPAAAAAEQNDDENDDPQAAAAAPTVVIAAPHLKYLPIFMKVLERVFRSQTILCRAAEWVRFYRTFSEKARSMAATSARLAFFTGLRSRTSALELPIIPSATAQDSPSQAHSAA